MNADLIFDMPDLIFDMSAVFPPAANPIETLDLKPDSEEDLHVWTL
jgi:hypothetical protein